MSAFLFQLLNNVLTITQCVGLCFSHWTLALLIESLDQNLVLGIRPETPEPEPEVAGVVTFNLSPVVHQGKVVRLCIGGFIPGRKKIKLISYEVRLGEVRLV